MPFRLALRPIERIERHWATLSAGTIDQTTGILILVCQIQLDKVLSSLSCAQARERPLPKHQN